MFTLRAGECLDLLRGMPDKSVDLVFTSPPYEDARTYGIDFTLKGQAWVDWCLPRFHECLRVCKGLVAWVVEGRTTAYRYSATPILLMADLHRGGVNLRKPVAFRRHGLPGQGGPDWLRNDHEVVICASRPGRLPWSDNTAMGHPPKYGCFGGHVPKGYTNGDVNNVPLKAGGPFSNRKKDGSRSRAPQKEYKLANPGNFVEAGDVVACGSGGGGKMGDPLAHENEAPFPEKLAEFFIRSFCPPGGVVLDPFCGSGTTLAVAHKHGRKGMGFDIRPSQIDLTSRRLESIGCKEVGVV